MVTIIMTSFNREDLIRESIQSIINQTFANWELLIADDGSTDDTIRIIEQIDDKRIKLLRSDHSGISGKLKNFALAKSNGELIAFLDSDDLWATGKLEQQVYAMHINPSCGFCVTNGYNFIKEGEAQEYFYKERQGIRKGMLLEAYFQSELAGFTQALMVRKECVITAGGFKEEKSFSDIDLIVSLASSYEGIILYEPLFFRRLHNNNYISDNWEKSYSEGLSLLNECRKKIREKVYRNAVYRLQMNKAEKYFLLGNKKTAYTHIFMAWRHAPFSVVPMKKLLKLFLALKAPRQKLPSGARQ